MIGELKDSTWKLKVYRKHNNCNNVTTIMFGSLIKICDLIKKQLEDEINKLFTVLKLNLETLIFSECVHLKSLLTINKIQNINLWSLFKWLKENNLLDIYPNVEILQRMFVFTPIANASAKRQVQDSQQLTLDGMMFCKQR